MKKAPFFIAAVIMGFSSIEGMDLLSSKEGLALIPPTKTLTYENQSSIFYNTLEHIQYRDLNRLDSASLRGLYTCLTNLYVLFICVEKVLPRDIIYLIFQTWAHVLLEKALCYNFELSHILQGHLYTITSVAISSNGKMMLTASKDHKTVLWNHLNGAFLHELTGHTNAISSVAFSPDSRRILTTSLDHTARLWDVENGLELFQLKHIAEVSSGAFSPDGTKILTGSFDCTARIWDAYTGIELLNLPHPGHVVSVAFNSDNKTIITRSAEKPARVFDIITQKQLLVLESMYFERMHPSLCRNDEITKPVAFSPDSKTILLGSWLLPPRFFDVKTGEQLFQLPYSRSINSIAFTKDETKVVLGSNSSVSLWDIQTGTLLLELPFNENSSKVTSVSCGPDNKTILVGTRDANAYQFSIVCDAYIWITTAANLLQTALILHADEAKKTALPFVIYENSFEHGVFKQLPDYVQHYLIRWYPIIIEALLVNTTTDQDSINS